MPTDQKVVCASGDLQLRIVEPPERPSISNANSVWKGLLSEARSLHPHPCPDCPDSLLAVGLADGNYGVLRVPATNDQAQKTAVNIVSRTNAFTSAVHIVD
eukprot:GHVU01233450.1.p1 GENE.GHVU01233450.1~~GHVU01233450.1.p1  ORF type:complete len:114 (-),score=22.88 GHVU01233450.1:134-436(-)